jgi:DNA polymerase-1
VIVVEDLLLIGDNPMDLPQEITVSVDTETTGLKWGESNLIGLSLAWRTDVLHSCYLSLPLGQMGLFAMDGIVGRKDLLSWLNRRVVMHNHPFDFRYLWRDLGVQPFERLTDTMHLAKHVKPHENLDLVSLYKEHVGPASPEWLKMKQRRGSLGKLPADLVAPYARKGAEATYELYEILRHKAATTPYVKLSHWDEQFQKLIMELVVRGLPVDRDFCRMQIRVDRQMMMELNTGMIRHGLNNPMSPKDVRSFAAANGIPLPNAKVKAGEKGHISTSEEDITKLSEQYPQLDGIVQYREYAKAISSWLEPLLALSEMDGHFHSELHPFGTKSFRMASRDINAQGMPLDAKDKRAGGSMMGVFRSDNPEYELWALDLKQAEVRLAAILSGDERLQAQMATGDDPYVALAKGIWNDETKRSLAKRAMLSSIYEVGSKTFAMRYGGSEAEAKAVLDAFRNRYPQIKRHSKNQTSFVERNLFVPLITGRPRYYWLGDSTSGDKDGGDRSYSAFNQEVQGSLAEIMHEVMLRYESAFPGQQLLQVHDSIVTLLPKDETKREEEIRAAGHIVQEVCESLMPRYARNPVPPMLLDTKKWEL